MLMVVRPRRFGRAAAGCRDRFRARRGARQFLRSRQELVEAHERAEGADDVEVILTLIDLIQAVGDLALAGEDLGMRNVP